MKRSILTLSLLFIFSSPVLSQKWKTYPYQPDNSKISFPVDEGRHKEEPVEWWYTSGHITGETTGKHYSYMLSYFHYPTGPVDGFRILNISDDDKGVFHQEMQLLTYSVLATDKLDLQIKKFDGKTESWKNKYKGTEMLPFEYEINAASAHVKLDLDYDSYKRPLIIGKGGYLKLGYKNYTYYYSQTGISVKGNITYEGITENVSGTSWIERQYSNLNPTDGTEYEWFSIQLSNKMDMNIWNMFTADNRVPEEERFKIFAAYVNEKKQYTISDFKLERLKFVYTPDRQRCYAQKWHLTSPVNRVDLMITTLYSDSEVQSPFRFYEGTTVITGKVNGVKVKGKGFVELLHSYDQPEMVFVTDSVWNAAKPIQWKLNNPDDGDPIKYDLEYSTENEKTFKPVVSGISGTSYKWNAKAVPEGDKFRLRLTGRSVDGTIKNSVTKEFVRSSGQ
jgi:predicted secreted hydrolase